MRQLNKSREADTTRGVMSGLVATPALHRGGENNINATSAVCSSVRSSTELLMALARYGGLVMTMSPSPPPPRQPSKSQGTEEQRGDSHMHYLLSRSIGGGNGRGRGEKKNRLKRSQSESKQNSSFTSANDAATEGEEKLRAL